MITTNELAKIAGVSQSTVSRSLHNSSEISQGTRDRIHQLAKEHGYKIRSRISSQKDLVNRKAIGLIISADLFQNPPDLYMMSLQNCIIRMLDARGYYAVILPLQEDIESIQTINHAIVNGDVGGFIIISTEHNLEIAEFLNRYEMPHVYAQYFSRPFKKSMNVVDVDHHIGGYLAAKHLLSLGHRKIATVTYQGSDFQDRTDGYLSAFAEYGILVDEHRIIYSSGNRYETGYNAASEYFETVRDCTAFFVQTDSLAIGFMNYLTDQGFDVPKNYSVIGFDGIVEGLYCRPALSTVVQPLDEVARLSIDRVFRLIKQGDTKITHLFSPPTLLVRASTAAPRTTDLPNK